MKKPDGLSSHEILALQQKYGLNAIQSKEKSTWVSLFLNQLKSPFSYILLAVGIVSFLLGQNSDGYLTISVLAINVFMGFYQEYSAQKTLASLHKLIVPRAIVIRDGKRVEIDVKNIVPGDIVVLGSGDRIPADGKLIDSNKILINEAIITGEEEAVIKNSDNANLFMGTIVTSGTGLMLVENRC